MRDDVYFAAHPAYSKDFLDAAINKIETYREYCMAKGKLAKWQRLMQNYYGISTDGTKGSSQITRGGDAGQLTMAKVNDFRNLVQHQLILVTSQRPAGQAKAINSDPESLHQARIGSLLTEYYMSQVGWERQFVRAAEAMLVVEESHIVLEWDATAGDPVRPMPNPDGSLDPNAPLMRTGDSLIRIIRPWNLARDPYLSSPEDMKWAIYSYRTNKYDLAVKFPNFSDFILKGNAKQLKEFQLDSYEPKDTDQITVHCLSHDPTPACPQGRVALFIPEAVLLDGPFPYAEFNIYPMLQNEVMETGFGYSNNSDLLALEEITDALHSVVMTNQTSFGVANIIVAKGININHTQLSAGNSYFEVDPAFFDKIKTLDLVRTAPEIFKYIDMLSTKKETLSGINSVVRGDPEGALRSNSGSALALVQAQSLQFNSGGQRAYYQALTKVNTGHIQLLQRYADNERIVRITGKVQGQYLQEFKYTGKELQNVSSVVFETVDPTFQTIGGKTAVADSLLQKNLIKNARQYLSVLRTGSLDAFTEDDEADEVAIKTENEYLREGKPVQVLIVENHEEHIQGHMSVIASPESKSDPKLVQTALAHIEQHAQIWQQLSQTNPALLIATKQKVLPPPPPPPGLPGPGAAPSPPPQGAGPGAQPPNPGGIGGPRPPEQGPHSPGGGAKLPQMLGNVAPVQTKAGTVKQPQMPINPATHDRAPLPPSQTGS